MLGVNETGSRSVGETHDARSMAMVREVLGFLADGYNGARGEADGLVKRLIEWNFGPQPAYPKVKLTPQRPELAPLDLAQAAAAAKSAGLFTPTLDDENSFRERAGFAPITEEEREENKPAPMPSPFGAPPLEDDEAEAPSGESELPEDGADVGTSEDEDENARPVDGAGEEDATPPADPKRASNRHLTASAQRGGWTPWRPLRASEEKMQLSDIDAYLTKQRDEYERVAKPQILGMLAMAAPAIQAAMADGTVTPGEVAAVRFDTTQLLEANRRYLQSVREKGAALARAELASGKTLRAAEEGEEDAFDEELADEADKLLDAQAKALTRRQTNRVSGEIEREAIDVIRTNGNASDVVARVVRRQIELGGLKADAGTVTAKVLNIGRDEAARLMGGVKEVEYSAILDTATCDSCRADDGKTAPFGSEEHDRLLPPNRDCSGGDNCRCLLAFIPGEPEDDGGEE